MSDAKKVTKDIAVAIQRKLDADTALAIAVENGRLQLRNAELAAECERLKKLDDPEFDCTDAAHPAWWRGHEHTTVMFCQHVNEILDGKEYFGKCNEPWETTRQRLHDLRTQLAAAQKTIEGLRSVIENDTENEESARAIAAEVFGKEWAEGDSLNVPNVVDFVERFRDELAAAQKTIEANKRAMEWALKALRSINGWLDSAYPSLREAREQNYAARHTLTAAIAATDGGV